MKKISKQLGFCIGISLLCMMAACKKNNGTPINGLLLKYFDYKIGTYWIMRDSISGRVDSFFVTSNKFSSVSGGGTSNANNIAMNISEYTEAQINKDSISWGIDLLEAEFYLYINCPKPDLYYPYNGSPLFSYPFSNITPYEYVFQSYILNGNTYLNVAEIIENTGAPYPDRFYLNTNVGFVKIAIYNSTSDINYVWELQRENIVH